MDKIRGEDRGQITQNFEDYDIEYRFYFERIIGFYLNFKKIILLGGGMIDLGKLDRKQRDKLEGDYNNFCDK